MNKMWVLFSLWGRDWLDACDILLLRKHGTSLRTEIDSLVPARSDRICRQSGVISAAEVNAFEKPKRESGHALGGV